MPITLDHQLKEYIPHNAVEFPISYFHDELATLPNFAGPLHWHPDFEIATAECVSLDYQVGENHIILEAGDSIFVNRNTIHGIKQLSGGTPDPMPNLSLIHIWWQQVLLSRTANQCSEIAASSVDRCHSNLSGGYSDPNGKLLFPIVPPKWFQGCMLKWK